jgi:hypothetical protein
MGLFGGSDSEDKKEDTNSDSYYNSPVNPHIVDARVENARSDTVTEQKLTKQSFDGNLGKTTILSEKPLSEFLNATERPHFIFHAEGKPPRKDGNKFLKPHDSGGLAVCFTDKRVILVAGMKDDNHTEEICYTDLRDYETSKGKMKHRISLETEESEYDIYISNYYSKNDLQILSDFLDGGSSASGHEPQQKSDGISKDGSKSVSLNNESQQNVDDGSERNVSQPMSPDISAEELLKYVDEDMKSRRKKELTRTEGETNKPVYKYIDNNTEYVARVLKSSSGNNWYKKNGQKETPSSGRIKYTLTNKEILVIKPEGEEDKIDTIKYSDIADFQSICEGYSSLFSSKRLAVEINTKENHYILNTREWDIVRFINFIRQQTCDEYEFVLMSPECKEKMPESRRFSPYVKVLDRETGVAQMESQGWNYGIGFVQRTKSKSVIEKQGYKIEASDIVIKQDEIKIEGRDNSGKSVTIRRAFDSVGTVDAHTGGQTASSVTVYTDAGVYDIETSYYPLGAEQIREYLMSKIETAEPSSQGEESAIEKIEKLADLRDNGVLTEKEFKEKKQELLDDL